MKYRFVIPGRVYTKNKRGYSKKRGKANDPYARALAWEVSANEHAKAQAREACIKSFPLIKDGPVAFGIELHIHGKKRADLQNYFKSICDAMEGVIYTNDRQIIRIAGSIVEAKSKEDEQLIVTACHV